MTMKTSLPDMCALEKSTSGNLSSEPNTSDKLLSKCEQLYKRYLVHVHSNLSKQAESGPKVYLSSVNDLTLKEFVVARKLYCKLHHKHTTPEKCSFCHPLICLAEKIDNDVFCELPSMYRTVFPNMLYKSSNAIRRLMQLPVVILNLELNGRGSQRLYTTEIQGSTNYYAFSNLCQSMLSKANAKRKEIKGIDKETLNLLCQLATTESDRCLIKFSVCKSQNLSSKKAKEEYGFSDLHGKEDKIVNAVKKSQAIRDAVMKLASVQHKATLISLGYEIPDDTDSSSSDSEASGSDTEDIRLDEVVLEQSEDRIRCEPEVNKCTASIPKQTENSTTTEDEAERRRGAPIDPDDFRKNKDPAMIVDATPSMEHLLYMLRANELNWFSFVEELRMLLKEMTPEALNVVLLDFAHYLSSSDIDRNEERLIEQSRQAFLERERQRVMNSDDDIVSDTESDNPDDWLEIDDISTKKANDMVVKQWKLKKARARVHAAKAVAKACLLKRRVTKKVSRIVKLSVNIQI